MSHRNEFFYLNRHLNEGRGGGGVGGWSMRTICLLWTKTKLLLKNVFKKKVSVIFDTIWVDVNDEEEQSRAEEQNKRKTQNKEDKKFCCFSSLIANIFIERNIFYDLGNAFVYFFNTACAPRLIRHNEIRYCSQTQSPLFEL